MARIRKVISFLVLSAIFVIGIYFMGLEFLSTVVIGVVGEIVLVGITRSKWFNRLLDFLFGKEEPSSGFPTQEQLEKIAKLEATEKHKLEEKDKRREELESYLKRHYENDLLPVMREWFKPTSKLDFTFLSDRPLEYSVISASIYYHPHGKSVVSELSEPKHFPRKIVEEVTNHLSKGYPEEWDKWIRLKNGVNSHLRSRVRTWKRIEDNVKAMAGELGLVEWDGKGSMPINCYLISHLVEGIWADPEYYQHQKKHIWDEYDIHHEKEGFEFGGIWAYAQKRETLEELKGCLTGESSKIRKKKRKIVEKKSRLESDGKSFESFLKTIDDDATRHHKRILSSCPTCEDWLVELSKLGA